MTLALALVDAGAAALPLSIASAFDVRLQLAEQLGDVRAEILPRHRNPRCAGGPRRRCA
jgi:hypothetical protein